MSHDVIKVKEKAIIDGKDFKQAVMRFSY